MKKYSVIILITLLFNACIKTDNTNYTSKLGGLRLWHGSVYGYDPMVGASYHYADSESAAVEKLNHRSIKIFKHTLYFISKDDVNHFYFFALTDDPTMTREHCELRYYYNSDSMHYYYTNGSAGGYGSTDLYTP